MLNYASWENHRQLAYLGPRRVLKNFKLLTNCKLMPPTSLALSCRSIAPLYSCTKKRFEKNAAIKAGNHIGKNNSTQVISKPAAFSTP